MNRFRQRETTRRALPGAVRAARLAFMGDLTGRWNAGGDATPVSPGSGSEGSAPLPGARLHSSLRRGPSRHTAIGILLGVGVLATLSGCRSGLTTLTGGWYANYDHAGTAFATSNRPMLLFYRHPERERNRSLEHSLQWREVREATEGWVKCRVFRVHEPDRRFMAQYGVERAPSLVVVLPDGSFRVRYGQGTAADILAFVMGEAPTLEAPRRSAFVPHEIEYRWETDYDAALRMSEQTGRPLLVALYRPFHGQWASLAHLLERPEVFRRVGDFVHYRNGMFGPPQRVIRSLGVARFPAVAVIEPGQTPRCLEVPLSLETLVEFVDADGPSDEAADRRPRGAETSGAEPSAAASRILPSTTENRSDDSAERTPR
jgi:hypothetical protein